MPRLYLAVSGHGYGHLGQVSALVHALRRVRPELELTVQCPLPREVIAGRIGEGFDHLPLAADVGMAMRGPLQVDLDASLKAYTRFHDRWPQHLGQAMGLLQKARPDLVLADIPYLTLAAAQRLDIPCMALCSLHWAAILGAYAGETTRTRPWIEVMLEAYRSAREFLRPEPAMPMPELPNATAIGPLARVGRNRRPEIDTRLGLEPGERLVLITLGGIAADLDLGRWPAMEGISWLADRSRLHGAASRMHPLARLADIPFWDLLASLDAVVTKPGYGLFTEAACNGLPLLYVPRGDWPEEPYLISWIVHRGRALPITAETLLQGDLADPLERLWALPSPPIPRPSGIEEGLQHLLPLLPG